MKKRVCSFLLVMAMLVSLFPVLLVSAAATPTYEDLAGWYVQELKDGGTAGTVTDKIVKIVEGDGLGYSSNRAMYIKWTSSENGSDWLNIENLGIQSHTASDRYTVSFRIKKVDTTGTYPDIMFGWTSGTNRLKSGYDGYVIGEADANGWQLVTASTTADAKRFFQLNVEKPSFEAYIDDFVVTKTGESTNLLVNGNFETKEEALDTTSLYFHEEKDFYKNSATALAEKSVRVSTIEAYQSEKSLHINMNAVNGTPYVNVAPLDANGKQLSLTANKDYKFSFYAKVVSGAARIGMQINTWGGTKLSALTGTDAGDGWKYYEVTGTCTNTSIRPFICMQGAGFTDVYIDNVSVECTTDAAGINMLPDQVSTLETPAAPWAPTYPAISAPTTTKALEEWTAKKGGSGTATTNTVVTAVGAENAYSGTQSLYVEFTADSYGQNWLDIKNPGTMFASLDTTKAYTVSLYMKGNNLTNVGLKMGTKYDDQKEDTDTNCWNISRMTPTKPEDEAKAEDGWRKYTATLYGPTQEFVLVVQCNTKVYIDDISIVATDAPTVNLLKNPGFEGIAWAPTYPTVTAPTTTKALEEWVAKASGSNITTNTIVTAVGAENAYSGTQSMYVEFAAASYGNTWVDIKNTGTPFASLDASKSYTVSMYVKGNKLGNAKMMMGWKYDDKYDENTRNYQMLSRMSATEPEDAAKAADGWRKYTAVLNAPETDFTIGIQCAAKVYIDDVSVVATDAPTVNLLNNPGFEGTPAVLPDITESALDTTKWTVSAGSIGTGTYTAGITAMEAQQGKKSLHVTWAATGSGYVQLQAKMNKLTDNENYTLKAQIKRISGNSAKIGSWKDWGGTGVGNTAEGEWEEMTITEACVGGPKIVQIILEGTTGVDMYIDNMVLTDSTGNVVWSEDFETATTGVETSAIKLFDEDMKEITELSSSLDGKTVTGAVAVTNYDKAGLTGQLLIAIYDGYELKELIMSDQMDILTTGTGTTLVTKEFTMPAYKSTYKIKAFIWDSVEGMNPLSRTATEL
ncbi:MAG: hypothetical protein IJB80_07060 [Clostridia bacterium]|nr:hypothetical protein [Clostridia bacterium]